MKSNHIPDTGEQRAYNPEFLAYLHAVRLSRKDEGKLKKVGFPKEAAQLSPEA